MMFDIPSAVSGALEGSGLSQRKLAEKTGISQSTVSRIIAGDRVAKLPELLLIADATGCTVAQLTGDTVADRVKCAARATNGSPMEQMKSRLLHFMEINAYLDDQGIGA